MQLCPVYLSLIHELWSKTSNRSFSLYKFVKIVEEMNCLFKSGQPGDSKDFIIFILEQLHKELKMPMKYETTEKKSPLNQYDKQNAFNYFFDEFKEEASIISDIFFGILEYTNICLNCKKVYNSKDYRFQYVIIMEYLIICKLLYDSVYTTRIFSSPNVLILILNRGQDNIYNAKLNLKR